MGTSPNAVAANNIEDVFLYADASDAPGTVLESLTLNAGTFHDPSVDAADLIVTVNSVTHPLLTAGKTYWVGLETGNPGINPVIWYFGFGSDPGLQVYFQGAWVPEDPQPQPPLSLGVQVSSAPEPRSWALLGAGWRFHGNQNFLAEKSSMEGTMKLIARVIGCVALAGVAWGQAAFEVATIKPGDPNADFGEMIRDLVGRSWARARSGDRARTRGSALPASEGVGDTHHGRHILAQSFVIQAE